MQNSCIKEGQLNWWLALLEIHKGSVQIPLPLKLKRHFNFYPSPPAKPGQPIDWSTGSVAHPELGHGPCSSGQGGPARWRPLYIYI